MVIRGTEALEVWSRRVTAGYPGVNIVNMTTSFKDGLAFAAILHRYCPHLIDFHGLEAGNIQANCELVFSTAEAELDIPALLDPQDMAACRSPDRRSILLYLSEFYSKLSPLTPVAKPRTIAPETSTTPVASSNEAKKSRSEYMKARGFTHSRSASIHKINFNSPSLTNLNTSTGSTCSSIKPVERKNSVDSGFETNLSCSIDSSSSSQGSPRVSPSFTSSTPLPPSLQKQGEARLPTLSSSRSTHHLPTTPSSRSLLNASSLSTSSFSLLSNSDFNVYSATNNNNNNNSLVGGRRSRGNLDTLKKLYRSEDRLHSLRDFALRDVAETTSEEECGSNSSKSPPIKPTVTPTKKLAKSNLNFKEFDSRPSLISDSSSPKSAFQAALSKFKQSESISPLAPAPPKREEPKATVDKVECFTQTDESHLVRRNQTTCVTPSKPELVAVAPTPLGRSIQPVRREPLVVMRRSQKPSSADRYNNKFRHSSYHFPSDFQANNYYHQGQSTLV